MKKYKEFKDYDVSSSNKELTAIEQLSLHVSKFPDTKVVGYSVGIYELNQERTHILVEYDTKPYSI